MEIAPSVVDELVHSPRTAENVAEPSSVELDSAPRLQWQFLPFDSSLSHTARLVALRLNSLGSAFFFGKHVLGMNRLVGHLHGSWLRTLSDPALHLVLEAPRDHLKTTCGTIILSQWWALPFDAKEEDWMRSLGYGDEWIRHMRRLHSSNIRTLIANQTEPNAIEMGFVIDHQYQSNPVFRDVFHDLIPGTGANWNQLSKTHKRSSGAGQGTYSFVGVGTVLQSKHFDRAIEDDLFGEDALYSPSVAQKTIEWHQRLPGAFDTDRLAPGFRNLELVIGNRWGIADLNAWIRENNPSFKFETHSALGGCCDSHPAGQPIFPEEFSIERLQELRVRFGIRSFSAHYLNEPITEEECAFRVAWLPRIRLFHKELGVDTLGKPQRRAVIEHLPGKDGVIREDILVADLERILILDPNHGGETGRARHAAIVAGIRRNGRHGRKEIYLLECWAKSVSHDAMTGIISQLAERWHVEKFYVEVIAGQDGWLRYFERDMYAKLPKMSVRALPKERGAGAKDRRINSMSALYERGQVHVRAAGGGVEDFLSEYSVYPNGKTVDLLDCMGYIFNIVESPEVDMNRWKHNYERDMEARRRSIGRAGY